MDNLPLSGTFARNLQSAKYVFPLGVLLLLLGCGAPQQPSAGEPAAGEITASSESTTTFTLAGVETHNSEESCYTAVNGIVYDITAYIPSHRGGKENIMKVCGRDGTALFMGKHGENAKANEQLQKFRIGVLAK